MKKRNLLTSIKSSALVSWLAGLALLSVNVFAQNSPPFLSVGSQTVNSNGATFLPPKTWIFPTGPGGGGVSQVTSPSPAVNFQGLTDDNTSWPPDTCGAVGTNHVVTMLNSQVRVATRSGTTITTLSLSNFWSGTNIGTFTQVFDPRIAYDPYNDRWIASASVEPFSSNSGILIGVSRTSFPTNTGDAGWNMHRIKADTSSQHFADFPMLGFNKDWIAVSANMFSNSTPYPFYRENFWVFDKTNLYAGNFTNPTQLSDTNHGFSEFPATTYDNTISTLYILQNVAGSQGGGFYRMLSITGAVTSPILNNVTNPIYIIVDAGWDDQEPNFGADFAPQLGLPSVKVQNNDSRIDNLVYKNGSLWYAQTVFLPAGSPTHSAVQWAKSTRSAGYISLAELKTRQPQTILRFRALP